MAKDIRERLLEQAIKFNQWQKATYPGKPPKKSVVCGRSIIHTGMTLTVPFAMC